MKKYIRKFTKKKWLIGIGLLFVLLFIMLKKDVILLILERDIDTIRHFLTNNIGYALLIMFLVMLVQNSFTLYPFIIVITINNMLFGFVNGFLWSWMSSVLSSTIVFYGVRYIFQDSISKKISVKLIEKVDAHGFAYVLQARIIPVAPTSLVNILVGLSTIRVLPFLFATAIGNFLFIFVLTLIQAGFLSADMNKTVIWIIIVVAVLLFYLIRRVIKTRNQHH